MPKLMSKNEFRKLVSYFLLALAVIVAYKMISDINAFTAVISRFFSVVSPFFFGFVLAYLLNMPRGSIEELILATGLIKKDKCRGLSILITYALFLLILYIALSLIVPVIYREMQNFVLNLPQLIQDIFGYFENSGLRNILPQAMQPENIISGLTGEKILSGVGLDNIWSSIKGILGVSSYLVSIVLAFISSIYFMIEGPALLRFISRTLSVFLPKNAFLLMQEYTNKVNMYFKRFLYCLILDAIIMGTLATIILTLIGSEYAPLLGPALGLCNLVPYFGSIIGVTAIVIITALTGGFAKAGITLVLLVALQQIDGNFTQPKLLGGSLKISPLLVIFGITIGGAYFGVLGMIIAIPIAATLKDMLREIIDYKEKNRHKHLEENDDITG